MSEEVNNEGHLRKYLLGELNEAEKQALEERLMTEAELFDLLQVAEDELVDDHLSGALSASERGRIDGFFLSTPERRRKLSLAMALRRYVTAEVAAEAPVAEPAKAKPSPRISAGPSSVIGHATWWNRAFTSAYLRMAAAAVVVIGLGLGIWRVSFHQPAVSKGMAALREAYPDQRPTEARITELKYAPPPPTTRGPERDRFDYVALDRARALIQLEANEHPSAQSYHDLGRLYLAQGDFDKAIDQFEKALKLDEKNAQLHSDYGAALLEKGKVAQADQDGKSLEALATALDHLDRAFELDGSLLEALFNRALCRQHMMLTEQAAGDWRSYIEKDPTSHWADEARHNLQLIEDEKKKASQSKEEILQSFISAYEVGDYQTAWRISSQNREALSGKCVAEQLLNGYLDLSLSGKLADARKTLDALLQLGKLEEERGGDRYTLGLAQFYASTSPKQMEELSQAQKLMSAGKSYFTQGNPKQAIEAYTKARLIFSEAGDKRESVLADYWIAVSYPARADTRRSGAMYEELERTCKDNSFEWLLMRTLTGSSIVHFDENNYSRAIEYTNRARELAERMNDANGTFNAWSYLIEYYRYIGNYSQSLYCVQQSLPLIDTASLGKLQRCNHYKMIAKAFTSAGFYTAAANYIQEALALAKAIDNPAILCGAYAYLGLIYASAGNYEQAMRGVQLAYETARTCPDDDVSKSQMAYSVLQMGHIYRQSGDFSRAIENYNESIDIYKGLDYPTFTYQAHKGKLICYIAQHNDVLAGQELQTTLDLIEKYRSTILDGDNRNKFFDMEQTVYDLAIDFECLRMNDPKKGFEYSEASRARSLLDLLTTNTQVLAKSRAPELCFQDVAQPLSLTEVLTRLPDQTQILQYAVLPDRLLIWIVSRTDFSIVQRSINQGELTEKVRAYLRMISSQSQTDAEELPRGAKELFDLLIAPAELKLDPTKQLCIVPDKILCYLPFAALMSATSNRYLVEDYPIMYSPSSSALVLCSEQARRKEGARVERLLSVGNPSFDRRAFPSLPDLPSAGSEAQGAASCYGSSRCLVGNEARKNLVMAELEKSDVIHFALHSLVDDRSPLRSKLVLAKDRSAVAENGESPDVIEAHEIYKLKLRRARLVVLSACQTGVDRYYDGEGMISIARPFIVAGVPIAIASLWPVNSDYTAQLMISFHQHRKRENAPTTEALRRAQREMIRSSDRRVRHPYCWASFTPIGGYTTF